MAKSGIETGNQLYPGMEESLELRWAFIRTVYQYFGYQILVTVAHFANVFFVDPIPVFIFETSYDTPFFYVLRILLTPLFLLGPLFDFEKVYPINSIVLSIFTLTLSVAVGFCCSLSEGKIVLEAAILTAVMVLGLTIYTFWAVKRGHDFSFLGQFLFGSLLIILAFTTLQALDPVEKLLSMIFSGLGSIVFCGYIIYDTNQLIKKLDYDKYIVAAARLYLIVMNLFLNLLGLMSHEQNLVSLCSFVLSGMMMLIILEDLLAN